MLFVLGIKHFWDKNHLLFITMLLLSISIIVAHMLAFPTFSVGGGDPPFRYYIPIIPMIAIPFALGFQKFSRNWIYRTLLFILLSVSVAFSFVFAYERYFSISHTVEKSQVINTVYQGIDILFPSLGPERFALHHPLTIYNEIFLLTMIVLLSIGIIIPFIKKQKVVIG